MRDVHRTHIKISTVSRGTPHSDGECLMSPIVTVQYCINVQSFCVINKMPAKMSEDVHRDMTREVSNAEASSSPLTERMAQVSKSAHRRAKDACFGSTKSIYCLFMSA